MCFSLGVAVRTTTMMLGVKVSEIQTIDGNLRKLHVLIDALRHGEAFYGLDQVTVHGFEA